MERYSSDEDLDENWNRGLRKKTMLVESEGWSWEIEDGIGSLESGFRGNKVGWV